MTILKLKGCLFGVTNIVKQNDKSKLLFIGYGIGSDGAGSQIFGNNFSRNVLYFGVDNSS